MPLLNSGFIVIMQHFTSAFKQPLFLLYISAVIVDIVLGNVKAWKTENVQSDVGIKGTLKHFGVLTFAMLFLPSLSYYLHSNTVSLAILGYLVYQYTISIIENLGVMGYKMPAIFEKSLQQLNHDNEENKKDDA